MSFFTAKVMHYVMSMMMICIPGMLLGIMYAPKPHTKIGRWYDSLIKPKVNPPKWVFNVVWTILYTLMGVALYRVFMQRDHQDIRVALILFAIQYLLNLCWMPTFFRNKSLVGSLFITGLMIPFIFWTMFEFYKVSATASYLLLPYATWVIFAAFLSFRLVQLNKKLV